MYIEGNALILGDSSYLEHHGILGQKWGIRRFQNKDGTRTAAGKARDQKNAAKTVKNAKLFRTSANAFQGTTFGYGANKRALKEEKAYGDMAYEILNKGKHKAEYDDLSRDINAVASFEYEEYSKKRDAMIEINARISLEGSGIKNPNDEQVAEEWAYWADFDEDWGADLKCNSYDRYLVSKGYNPNEIHKRYKDDYAKLRDLASKDAEEYLGPYGDTKIIYKDKYTKEIVKTTAKDELANKIVDEATMWIDDYRAAQRADLVYTDKELSDMRAENAKYSPLKHSSLFIEDGTLYLSHHGIKGQRWGIRRFQNEDGSLTPLGEKRIKKLKKIGDKDNKQQALLYGQSNLYSAKSIQPIFGKFKNLDSETEVLKAGAKINRIATENEPLDDKRKYVSFTSGDNAKYKFFAEVKELGLPKDAEPYAYQFRAIKDIRIANGKAIESFIVNDIKATSTSKKQKEEAKKIIEAFDKHLDNEAIIQGASKVLEKAMSVKEGSDNHFYKEAGIKAKDQIELYRNTIKTYMEGDPKKVEKLADHLRSRGYDAYLDMVDARSSARWKYGTDYPLIMMSPKDNMELVKSEKLKHTSIGGTMYIEGNALILGGSSYLEHHGVKGQRWGVRRFQNRDGSLTNAGRKRLGYATKGVTQTVSKAFKAGAKAGGNAVKAVKAHHEAAEAKKKEKKKEKASKTRLGVMANKDLFTNEEIRKLNERFKLEDEMKMATLQKGVEIAKAVGTIAQNVGTMAKAYEDVTGQSLSPIKRKAAEEKAKQDAEDRKRKLAKEDAETKRAEDKEKRDIEDRERRIKLEDEDRVRKQAKEDADAQRAENAEKRAQAKEQRDSSMAVELQRKAKAAADEQEHKAVKAKAESRSAILDVLEKIDKIQDHDDDDHNNPPGGGIDTWDDDDYLNFFKKTGIIHSGIIDSGSIQNGVLFVDSSDGLAHHGVSGTRMRSKKIAKYESMLKQSDKEEGMYHVENGTLFINAGEPYLEHHGVKGMKWGKHLMAGKGVDAEGGGGGGFAEDDEKLKEMAKKAGMSVAEYRTKMAGKLGGAASKVGEKVYDAAGGKYKKEARELYKEASRDDRVAGEWKREQSALRGASNRKRETAKAWDNEAKSAADAAKTANNVATKAGSTAKAYSERAKAKKEAAAKAKVPKMSRDPKTPHPFGSTGVREQDDKINSWADDINRNNKMTRSGWRRKANYEMPKKDFEKAAQDIHNGKKNVTLSEGAAAYALAREQQAVRRRRHSATIGSGDEKKAKELNGIKREMEESSAIARRAQQSAKKNRDRLNDSARMDASSAHTSGLLVSNHIKYGNRKRAEAKEAQSKYEKSLAGKYDKLKSNMAKKKSVLTSGRKRKQLSTEGPKAKKQISNARDDVEKAARANENAYKHAKAVYRQTGSDSDAYKQAIKRSGTTLQRYIDSKKLLEKKKRAKHFDNTNAVYTEGTRLVVNSKWG